MKKILSLLVCLGLVIAMGAVVGCGDTPKSTTVTPAKDAPPKDAPAKDKK